MIGQEDATELSRVRGGILIFLWFDQIAIKKQRRRNRP